MNRSREDLTFDVNDVDCIVCDERMVWDDESREWVCPKCGNTAFQTYDCGEDEIYYEHGPADDYEEYFSEN